MVFESWPSYMPVLLLATTTGNHRNTGWIFKNAPNNISAKVPRLPGLNIYILDLLKRSGKLKKSSEHQQLLVLRESTSKRKATETWSTFARRPQVLRDFARSPHQTSKNTFQKFSVPGAEKASNLIIFDIIPVSPDKFHLFEGSMILAKCQLSVVNCQKKSSNMKSSNIKRLPEFV